MVCSDSAQVLSLRSNIPSVNLASVLHVSRTRSGKYWITNYQVCKAWFYFWLVLTYVSKPLNLHFSHLSDYCKWRMGLGCSIWDSVDRKFPILAPPSQEEETKWVGSWMRSVPYLHINPLDTWFFLFLERSIILLASSFTSFANTPKIPGIL